MFLKKMTDEQRYSAVIKSLGEIIEAQRDTINIQEYRIEELVKNLGTAEKKLAEIETLSCKMNAVKEGGVRNG